MRDTLRVWGNRVLVKWLRSNNDITGKGDFIDPCLNSKRPTVIKENLGRLIA